MKKIHNMVCALNEHILIVDYIFILSYELGRSRKKIMSNVPCYSVVCNGNVCCYGKMFSHTPSIQGNVEQKNKI